MHCIKKLLHHLVSQYGTFESQIYIIKSVPASLIISNIFFSFERKFELTKYSKKYPQGIADGLYQALSCKYWNYDQATYSKSR